MSVEWINPEPIPTPSSGYNALNYTEQGGTVTHIGGDLIFEEGAYVEGFPLPFDKVQHQDASTATTVAGLKDDFNDLLMRLIAAGIMDEGEFSVK